MKRKRENFLVLHFEQVISQRLRKDRVALTKTCCCFLGAIDFRLPVKITSLMV